MGSVCSVGEERAVRVVFPVRVEFAGESFCISEFTANLSVGGLFLPTEVVVPPLVLGSLTFQISQWETPFTVRAQVVRVAPPGGAPTNHPRGLAVQFVDLTPRDHRRIERVLEGIHDGSVVQAIRKAQREEGRELQAVLRGRPTDHKIVFAATASGTEIEALIRDGNQTVVKRLLDNPRLAARHVRLMLRDGRTSPVALLTIARQGTWFEDEECRELFCQHPRADLQEVMKLMSRLARNRLVLMSRDSALRPQVRARAKQMVAASGG